MKILLRPLTVVFISASIFLLAACNETGASGPKDCFKNQKDSIDFAKAVYEKYKIAEAAKVVSFVDDHLKITQSQPVHWDTISKYAVNYDKAPILTKPDKTAYKGFILNSASFTQFKDNVSCAQLYFRLGKKDNGEYTIMVLPMDANNAILQNRVLPPNQNLNHDHLDPCPTVCPTNWQ
jgi:hypothetical protein